ncbi:MAG: PadR family transcriptional regulator [Planctomycetota bacterium]
MAESSLLESVVLGIVWKLGPMTPYAIRQEFVHSPSSSFSASTGAIYPLVDRLVDRGWLGSKTEATGKRPRRMLKITRSGAAALRRWLRSEPNDADLSVPFDSLRTRIYFLAALRPDERRRYLDSVVAGLEARIQDVRAYCQSYETKGRWESSLAASGYLELAKARLRWAREVQRRLEAADESLNEG